MSITAITIENFKGIKGPVRIELKPITLLFGPNSAGKSTVLHALQYAYEIFCNRNFNPDRTYLGGDQINLGGFTHLVHRRNVGQTISLRLDIDLADRDDPFSFENETLTTILGESEEYRDLWNGAVERMAEVNSAWVKVDVAWSHAEQEAFVKAYEVGVNGESLAALATTSPAARPMVTAFNPTHPLFKSETFEEERKEIESETHSLNENRGEDIFWALGAAFLFPQLRPILGTYAGARFIEECVRKEGADSQVEISCSPSASKLMKNLGDSRLLSSNADITLQSDIGDGSLPDWEKVLPLQLPTSEDVTETFNQLNVFFLSALIVGPGKALANDLQKMRYVGPIRAIPDRNFTPQQSDDPKRMATGLAAWDSLSTVEGLRDRVNKRLKKMDVAYTIEPRELIHFTEGMLLSRLRELQNDPDAFADSSRLLSITKDIVSHQFPEKRFVLHDENNGIDVQLHDVGVGISQMLPVIIEALNTKTGTILEIEQPELHIHPKLQVELADVFIAASQASEMPIFLIETHSEHLMLRFLKRIRETAEGELPPDMPELDPARLAIYYIESTTEGSQLVHIRVSEEGEFIDRWPSGFFEERYEELFK